MLFFKLSGLSLLTTIFIAACILIAVVFIYLATITSRERRIRETMQRSLDKLTKAYDELDAQAKIIVKKDLELNKTQEELDKKLSSLYTLHKLSKALISTFDTDKLFSQINLSFISELGFDKGIIVLEDKEALRLVTAVGFTAEGQEGVKKYLREKNILSNITSSILLDNEKTSEYAPDISGLLSILSLSSLCIVPIVSQEAKLGTILVGNDLPYAVLTEGDVEILSILAGQIASGIENAKLYEELWKSHQELEQRVNHRTKELALANEKLRNIDKLKSDFVSAVSHELRTPLTSIKGYAAILIAEKLGPLPPAVKERLEKINKHSDSLTKLVNDLLDISRIESGKTGMKLERVNLTEIAEEVSDIIMPQLKEKNIRLVLELPQEIPLCLADKTQIGRVFTNLLSNALKFTPEKGSISIKVKDSKNLAQVDIHDTGIGIAEDDLARIFEEFYRIDNPINQQIKGTGLGLSLVKHIIEAHKGKIWVTSALNKGTTFSFTLPKA